MLRHGIRDMGPRLTSLAEQLRDAWAAEMSESTSTLRADIARREKQIASMMSVQMEAPTIAMARRMLYEAATGLSKGVEPPALDASEQRVRPASVLLPKTTDPIEWSKTHLANDLEKPVYSI